LTDASRHGAFTSQTGVRPTCTAAGPLSSLGKVAKTFEQPQSIVCDLDESDLDLRVRAVLLFPGAFKASQPLRRARRRGGARGRERSFPRIFSNMRFQSDPNLKPTEVQPPSAERRTPAVLARKPATRAPMRRALRKGGTIALKGGMRVLNLHRRFLIKSSLPDKRISLAIAFLIISCIGVAAALVWQSSRQVVSVPQAAVALSPTLEQQLEAMSSGLAAIQQSVDELATGLGQMKRDIANLQTTEQALSDKVSEPRPRPPAAPSARSTPRSSQTPAR
jgi:hypothetical protein